MTLDEALQELGIERSATPDEARRAYLRGIKARKPETDPEGFRRLREAYEMVSGLLKEQPAPAPVQREEAPDDEEDEEDWEEEAAPPELAGLAARLSGLPPATHREERLAVLRQAVQDHPSSSGVRWWLVQELSQNGLEKELLDVLRDGDAAGFPGFLETRAVRFPDSVSTEDLARLENSGDLDTLSVTAKVYLQRSQPREAVAALSRVIDRLLEPEGPAARSVSSWLPRMMLEVEAAGLAQDAQALHDRLWLWLSGTGDAGLLKSWGEVHWWKVAHELGQLDPAFPAELRQAAARAALDGDEKPAEEKARRFAKAKAKQAEHFSTMLYDLPMLYNLYYRILQGAEPDVLARKQQTSAGLGMLALLLVIFAVSIYTRGCTESYDGPSSVKLEGLEAQQLRTEASRAWAALEGACDGQGHPLPRSSCEIMRRAVLAMENGDCTGARQALDDLGNSLRGAGVTELTPVREFGGSALLAVTLACRTSP